MTADSCVLATADANAREFEVRVAPEAVAGLPAAKRRAMALLANSGAAQVGASGCLRAADSCARHGKPDAAPAHFPAGPQGRPAQRFHHQHRRILMQTALRQLPEVRGNAIHQFVRQDLALSTPMPTTGIGDTLDIRAGAGAGLGAALLAGAESVRRVPLQRHQLAQ
jgi:hypothetical protein